VKSNGHSKHLLSFSKVSIKQVTRFSNTSMYRAAIGAATAVLAAQQGWAVAVNYASNASAAHSVVQQIQDAGGTAIAVQGDVGDEAHILRMFAEVDAKLGRISGLVNNAGVVDVTAKVQDQSWARWERMMHINVLGSFACACEAVKRMSTAHGGSGGSIVNVSSAAARLGAPGQYVDYAAAKSAIDAFIVGLAKEVAQAIVWPLSDAASTPP
jgi:NAD(P)-dependent dehydrogenase (short-subunit alcohol dehydrogenase family)